MRGALMGILNWDHPDVEKFVYAKKDNDGESVLKYFNISVGVTDSKKFLQLLQEDGDIELHHPSTGVTGKIKASKLLREMAEQAWKTGDPGLIKLDEINKYSAYDVPIEATNPCGWRLAAR